MRHAVCIMGFGDERIAQKTINVLDDTDIDFFIHWDKKYPQPDFRADYSKILYADRIRVNWGSYEEILAEIKLLERVKESGIMYDYVHLISSTDIPLMTKDYFKQFFTKNAYIGFQKKLSSQIEKRISFFYPTSLVNVRNKLWIIKVIKIINYVFKINRLKSKNLQIRKGPNWFSIKFKYINKILNYDSTIFKNSYLGDELFIQTILSEFETDSNLDDNSQAARYIRWSKGKAPHPITFTLENISELRNNFNSTYAFARKVKDPVVVDKLYKGEKI